jgi:hypothetical protein
VAVEPEVRKKQTTSTGLSKSGESADIIRIALNKLTTRWKVMYLEFPHRAKCVGWTAMPFQGE